MWMQKCHFYLFIWPKTALKRDDKSDRLVHLMCKILTIRAPEQHYLPFFPSAYQ